MGRWKPRNVLIGVGMGVVVAFPFVVKSDFFIHTAIMVMLWSMVCLSLNIIFGYAGQLSLGHGALFGIGAYTCAILVTKAGWNFWVALPVASMGAGFIGFLIGIPSLKAKGPYFVIVTLGFNVIITEIIENWDSLTGGVLGLYGIPKPAPILGLRFETKVALYFLILMFLSLSLLFVRRIITSVLGKNFIAIRENEELARSVGINTMNKKIMAFTLSSILAGLAGGLFSAYLGVVVPQDSGFTVAFDALVYLSVGGMGTLAGTIIGPLIISNIPEILRAHANVMSLFNGLVLLVIIIFMPQGIVGKFRQWRLKSVGR